MSGAGLNFTPITSGQIESISARANQKKAEGKARSKTDINSHLESIGLRKPPTVRAPKAASSALPQAAIKAMDKMQLDKEQKAQQALKMSKLRKYHMYQAQMPNMVRPGSKVSANMPMADLDYELDYIRASASGAMAPEIVREGFFWGLQALEDVIMVKGVNPMKLDLTNFVTDLKDHEALLETELTEIQIELHDLFFSNCYVRMGMKLFKLAYEHSQRRKHPELSRKVRREEMEDELEDLERVMSES